MSTREGIRGGENRKQKIRRKKMENETLRRNGKRNRGDCSPRFGT
jgi:hypothetical protein